MTANVWSDRKLTLHLRHVLHIQQYSSYSHKCIAQLAVIFELHLVFYFANSDLFYRNYDIHDNMPIFISRPLSLLQA